VDRRELEVDGGIFASSGMKYVLSHPHASSSMMLEKPDILVDPLHSPGRGTKQGRKKYVGPILPHTYEPSKFWEMQHAEKDILIPMPLMSYRDPSIPSLAERRQARMNSRYQPVHPTTRRISKGAEVPAAQSSMASVMMSADRPSSAPPRSSSGRGATGIPMESIQRWGTQTLADYAQVRGHETSFGFQVTSNPSLDSSAIVAAAYDDQKMRYGTAENALRVGSRTLRKQAPQNLAREPPFATGY
jgi:hypothetical protein